MRSFRYRVGAFAAMLIAGAALATEYTVDPAESLFAVVVHKGGVAARFAHNHLIYPAEYTASLALEDGDPKSARFELSFPVKHLRVDEDAAHEKWYPLVEKNGILDEPFAKVGDDDRKVIAEHMLGKDQLDAEQFPDISAKLISVRDGAGTHGKQRYAQIATIVFTVHGKTVERECPATIAVTGDGVTVDASGTFKFTEFGFKPYSAMLGAVKNLDAFDVLVHVQAKTKTS